ncbi:hypothetical protein Tmar_0059 [Thermaerobacter marianensis DSM 12885]|uniref:Uncharacterized protein n=1 Tax=Thermaerobacter marianensis (strain ATCC 700841 / DSM 12885 / JCM 10246 / 7p75a) TaxID=644966 RepID=E6SKJ7_THEM7|nr:hypothetical protein [Thermaerobacter marianensis]ADU50184.1 hypothetical protein Tmar_0059 [Thermaerobacter marianensis DSM 12885]
MGVNLSAIQSIEDLLAACEGDPVSLEHARNWAAGRLHTYLGVKEDSLRPGYLYLHDSYEAQALVATDIIFVRASYDPEETKAWVREARKYTDRVIKVPPPFRFRPWFPLEESFEEWRTAMRSAAEEYRKLVETLMAE